MSIQNYDDHLINNVLSSHYIYMNRYKLANHLLTPTVRIPLAIVMSVGAVVVAQLVERSLPFQAVRSSNPIIGKKLY